MGAGAGYHVASPGLRLRGQAAQIGSYRGNMCRCGTAIREACGAGKPD